MKPLYFTLRSLMAGIFKVFYRHRVYGLQHIPHGKIIIAPTHTSYFDPILVGISVPEEIHFLAKRELFEYPIFGNIITRLNSHPVSGTTQDLASFRLIGELIKHDKKIVIFPEGLRTVDGQISTVKAGIGMLAHRNHCSILPVYIHGAHEAWPVGRRYPKVFGKTAVVFGSPVLSTDGDKKQIAAEVELRLHRLREWYVNGAEGDPP